MKKLEHPNVIVLLEVTDDAEKDQLFMIIDFTEYGLNISSSLLNLFTRIFEKNPEKRINM